MLPPLDIEPGVPELWDLFCYTLMPFWLGYLGKFKFREI